MQSSKCKHFMNYVCEITFLAHIQMYCKLMNDMSQRDSAFEESLLFVELGQIKHVLCGG